jgi:hypothetical protein
MYVTTKSSKQEVDQEAVKSRGRVLQSQLRSNAFVVTSVMESRLGFGQRRGDCSSKAGSAGCQNFLCCFALGRDGLICGESWGASSH